MTRTIAITGATGFIGSHLVAALRQRGHTVRALTRRAHAPRDGIIWVAGDINDDTALRHLVEDADAVVHCAGMVKARDKAAFFAANAGAVTRLLAAVTAAAPAARLVHLSSLAAREPGLSSYAASKAAGETVLRAAPHIAWSALRPPAVYGPGDREILKLFKSLAYGVGFLPGHRNGRVSLLHVQDLVAAVMALLESPPDQTRGRIFELDDGRPGGYAIAQVYETAAQILRTRIRLVTVPASLLTLTGGLNQAVASLTRGTPMLTPGKVRELTHPDWVARQPLFNESGLWQPQIPLDRGLAETLAWYRHNRLF